MRSKTSFFDMTLFKKTLLRFWPIWLAYAFVWLLALPVSIISNLRWVVQYGGGSAALTMQSVPYNMAAQAGAVICLIFAGVSAAAVFSFMYFPRQAGAYGSLPIKREGVFTSIAAAGLAPLLAVNILVFLISLLVEAYCGTVAVGPLLVWLAVVSMLDVGFFGFAAFCAQLTGNAAVMPMLYAVLSFIVAIVEAVVRDLIIYTFCYGYSYTSSDSFMFLSPAMYISMNCGSDAERLYDAATGSYAVSRYEFTGWLYIALFAVSGVLFLAASLALYKRRRLETAGDVVAVRPLRPVFKYCMTVGGALGIGTLVFFLLFSSNACGTEKYAWIFALFMVIGAFIGYFAAEMLINKSFNVFSGGKRWLGFGISCAVCVLALLSCEYDIYGYEDRLPDAGKVESVSVSASGESTVFREAGNIEAVIGSHELMIADKDSNEAEVLSGGSFCNVVYTYEMSDGSSMRRAYQACTDPEGGCEAVEALETAMNSKEAISERKSLDYDITADNITDAYVDYYAVNEHGEAEYTELTLTAAEAVELYTDCIKPDIDDMTLGRVWLVIDDGYYSSAYSCTVSISCSRRVAVTDENPDGYEYQYFYTVPTVNSTRTVAWLAEHGIELLTEGEMYGLSEKNDAIEAQTASVG